MKRGMPAAAILAGGISRHGSECGCSYCSPVEPKMADESVFAALNAGMAATTPTALAERADAYRRNTDAIDDVFAAARAAVALEAVCPSWSVAQHVRRSS